MQKPAISSDEVRDIIRENQQQFDRIISDLRSRAALILDRQEKSGRKKGGLVSAGISRTPANEQS